MKLKRGRKKKVTRAQKTPQAFAELGAAKKGEARLGAGRGNFVVGVSIFFAGKLRSVKCDCPWRLQKGEEECGGGVKQLFKGGRQEMLSKTD